MRWIILLLAVLVSACGGGGGSSGGASQGVSLKVDQDGCLVSSNANVQEFVIGSNVAAEHHAWWCVAHEGIAGSRIDMLFELDGTCRRLHKEVATPGVCDQEPPQNSYPTIRASLEMLYPANISDVPAERNNAPGRNLGYSLITYQQSPDGDYYRVGFGVEVTNTGTVPLYDLSVMVEPPAGSAEPVVLGEGFPEVVMPGESFVIHGVQPILDFPIQGGINYQYRVSLIDQFDGSAGVTLADAKAAWAP